MDQGLSCSYDAPSQEGLMKFTPENMEVNHLMGPLGTDDVQRHGEGQARGLARSSVACSYPGP